MMDREALIHALVPERALTVEPEYVADDIDFEFDTVDRERIALSLWRMGYFSDHLGECTVENDVNYVNTCASCQEEMLAMADRVLSRIALAQ